MIRVCSGEAVIVNLPEASVWVLRLVPFTETFAPSNGELSLTDVTVPDIALSWAKEEMLEISSPLTRTNR